MGRGSKTSESSVVKERPAYSALGAGSGSVNRNQSASACLFSVRGTIGISSEDGQSLSESSPIVIVPSTSDSDSLEIYIGGKSFGKYVGSSSRKISDCIKEGYVYEGVVEKITKAGNIFSVSFKIQGYGRQSE